MAKSGDDYTVESCVAAISLIYVSFVSIVNSLPLITGYLLRCVGCVAQMCVCLTGIAFAFINYLLIDNYN